MTETDHPLACRVIGLAKSFGDRHIFSALDLELPAGEVLAVVGNNGSGKSTLLRCVAGLLDVSAGSVEIAGVPVRPGIDQPEIRRQMALAADEPALYEDLSARQHVQFVAGAWGEPEAVDSFDNLLADFDLVGRADDQVGSLSRGMRQKVALALALCHQADLYLFDEPFAGLDARGRDAFLGHLASACEKGAGAIVVTHALNRVDDFADSVLDMSPEVGVDDGFRDDV